MCTLLGASVPHPPYWTPVNLGRGCVIATPSLGVASRLSSGKSAVMLRVSGGRDVMMQVLVMGKVSQAVVVAGAAYRDEAAFAKITGITNVKMIDDKGKTDVQVGHLPDMPYLTPSHEALSP